MGRVVITNVSEAATTPFPALAGVTVTGNVETKPVIGADGRPILLWQHTMAPGSEIHWQQPPSGQISYVWDGEAEVDGAPLHKEGALVVEHGGKAVLRAKTAVTLLHFHRPDNHPEKPAKAGGHVHVVNHTDAKHYETRGILGDLWADSGCPSCELWLHRNTLPASADPVGRHSHTEDEVIFIVGGSMTVGRRNLPTGTALAIDADTVYTFSAGKDGLAFINFRPCEPYYRQMTDEGLAPPLSERDLSLSLVAKTAQAAE